MQLHISFPLFIMRVITVSFFSIGFIQYFHRLWIDAFENEEMPVGARRLRRVLLTLVSVVLALFIHFAAMAYIHNDSAVLYHNWALFVLTLPVLYEGFNRLEEGLQFATMMLIWYMHHEPNFFQPKTLIALVGFLVIVLALKRYHQFVIVHWWAGMVSGGVLAALFWSTVPPVSMGVAMTPSLEVEAVVLYTLMIAFVLGYWLRQYREDLKNHELAQLAHYEEGTRQNQQAAYQAELQMLFSRSLLNGESLTFATLDLDHFKQVNDQYGHLAGNAVLIGVADTVKTILDKADVPLMKTQLTGETFNIVFPNRSAEEVMPVIKDCWQAIRKQEYDYEGRGIAVTASVGVTALRQTDKSVNDVYKRADDALSKCKRNGRDIITFDDKLVSGVDKIEKKLADYRYIGQGVYDLTKPEMPKCYHELLLRSHDTSQDRWYLPDTFEIPVWIQIHLLKTVMSHTTLQNFNVNLTADQFKDLDFAEALTQFAESPDGPDNLTVEITDLSDSQTTRRISAIYRAAGMKILIDDVGSDNDFEIVRNSMPYINGIKFAMQNLRKTTNASELRERVKFWRQVAAENDLTFILEGVETKEDLEMAQELKVANVQGYYFSKPEPFRA